MTPTVPPKSAPKKASRSSALKSVPPAPSVPSAVPESRVTPQRNSIFDSSYAQEGAELRKAWSRFNRKG